MKKSNFFLLIFFYFLNLWLSQPSFGQEPVFDLDRAYQDYLYATSQYKKGREEYLAARNAYLTYQTTVAKEEAALKTTQMLSQQDELVRTYLVALRLRLSEATQIINYEQNLLYLQLEKEAQWYLLHQENLTSGLSLEELENLSLESKERYPQTQALAYQALGMILKIQIDQRREQLTKEAEKLKTKFSEIEKEEGKETDLAWQLVEEGEKRLGASLESQTEAEAKLKEITPYAGDKHKIYNEANFSFQHALQSLKEAAFYFQESIKEIKRAD